jgi:hypothetical protein
LYNLLYWEDFIIYVSNRRILRVGKWYRNKASFEAESRMCGPLWRNNDYYNLLNVVMCARHFEKCFMYIILAFSKAIREEYVLLYLVADELLEVQRGPNLMADHTAGFFVCFLEK